MTNEPTEDTGMGNGESRGEDWIDAIPEADRPRARRIAERITRSTALPAPAFRGDLRRHLVAAAESGRIRGAGAIGRAAAARRMTALGGSGAALLLSAIAGLAGIGPLSA